MPPERKIANIIAIGSFILAGCGPAKPTEPTFLPTPDATALKAAFEQKSEKLFLDYLTQQGFKNLESGQALGATVHILTRGDEQVDTQRIYALFPEVYRAMQGLAFSFKVPLPPESDDLLAGHTFYIGLAPSVGTCLVSADPNTTFTVGREITDTTDYSVCDTNAFSTAVEATTTVLQGTVSNHHLIISTALPAFPAVCPPNTTRLAPLGQNLCVTHAEALYAGFAHEVFHQLLRAITGLSRQNGPLSGPSDIPGVDQEEIFAQTVELSLLQKSP